MRKTALLCRKILILTTSIFTVHEQGYLLIFFGKSYYSSTFIMYFQLIFIKLNKYGKYNILNKDIIKNQYRIPSSYLARHGLLSAELLMYIHTYIFWPIFISIILIITSTFILAIVSLSPFLYLRITINILLVPWYYAHLVYFSGNIFAWLKYT